MGSVAIEGRSGGKRYHLEGLCNKIKPSVVNKSEGKEGPVEGEAVKVGFVVPERRKLNKRRRLTAVSSKE